VKTTSFNGLQPIIFFTKKGIGGDIFPLIQILHLLKSKPWIPCCRRNAIQWISTVNCIIFCIFRVHVAGQWLKAEYRINGKVQDFSYEEAFDGDVYEIELYITEKFTSSDTTTTTETHLCEFYAPDIGLVRFYREGVEYVLLEYQLQ